MLNPRRHSSAMKSLFVPARNCVGFVSTWFVTTILKKCPRVRSSIPNVPASLAKPSRASLRIHSPKKLRAPEVYTCAWGPSSPW